MVYSNFYKTVWYTPQSERESVKPSAFLLQSPSYKLYIQIGNTEVIDGCIPEIIDNLLLEQCIISNMNIEGLNSYLDLPLELQQDLLDTILKLFYPSKDFYDSLNFSLDASLDDRFSNETWSCEVCKNKKLDRQRNCPYLDKDEFHEDSYTITVGETVYSVCPIPKKDNKLLAVAFEAYTILDSGYLPEKYGYGDQPLLFCILSQRVKEKIRYYERKQVEDERAKLKR